VLARLFPVTDIIRGSKPWSGGIFTLFSVLRTVMEVEEWAFVNVVKLCTLNVTVNSIRPDFYMKGKYIKWVTSCD
jgi:hypothetical protein